MKSIKKTKVNLTLDEVKHVAELANLSLTPKEFKKFQQQLSEVLDYVSQLSKVDTSGVEPTSQVTGLENVFREDQTKPSITQDEVLSETKNSHHGFFKVHKIFE